MVELIILKQIFNINVYIVIFRFENLKKKSASYITLFDFQHISYTKLFNFY